MSMKLWLSAEWHCQLRYVRDLGNPGKRITAATVMRAVRWRQVFYAWDLFFLRGSGEVCRKFSRDHLSLSLRAGVINCAVKRMFVQTVVVTSEGARVLRANRSVCMWVQTVCVRACVSVGELRVSVRKYIPTRVSVHLCVLTFILLCLLALYASIFF